MYTRTERWAAHCFKKFHFELELADGTLFEGETRWILEESPEITTKAVLSSLGDDGLERRRRGRRCSVTEVANYENVGQDCGNGTKALDSTEKTIEGTKKKQLIGIWTEKTGFSCESKVESSFESGTFRPEAETLPPGHRGSPTDLGIN
ncbi:hypothetical protein AVEN_95015-1 [Araneus ventricosus]|uniref:Uncharacterized protein n=1 Tax=Araneus ventricosus TaxID=182803 RepID=A0A4Y2N4Z2_ARAVE|nr:hypothetical protein AVEN_95015-1 [Araneus ventricosus]